MADFLSPRIRARARAVQAGNQSIGGSHDPVHIFRSHASHKRKYSVVETQVDSDDDDADSPSNRLSSLFEVQPRYAVWRRWVLALLLLLLVGLAVLSLENTLHAAPPVDTQEPTNSEPHHLGPTSPSMNDTVPEGTSAQGGVVPHLWEGGNSTRENDHSSPEGSATPLSANPVEKSTKKPLRRYPTIDRSILAKFGGLDPHGLSGDRELDEAPGAPIEPENLPSPPNTIRRYPTILHIPEGRASSKGSLKRPTSSSPQVVQDPPNICGPGHPSRRPCRFLLPLRMAEQESKARIHFTQVAQLARRLSRILVLPNVGKSRMGACYKYPFEAYYDVSPFFGVGVEPMGTGYVRLDDFRAWSEAQRKPTRSRLLSVAASVPQGVLDSAEKTLEGNNDLVINRYPTEVAAETEFPGCFPSKWTQLQLEDTSTFVALDSQNPSITSPMEFGELLASNIELEKVKTTLEPDVGALHTHPNELQEALQSPIEPDLAMRDPDVLILNWDLRRPIFSPDPSDVSLRYSPLLQDLATKLAPSSPYLAIHWRMETVDANVLEDCAHSLVAVLSDLLHDSGHLGLGVKKVWFASDYPYPISSGLEGASTAGKMAKSGTFKSFGEQHEAAVQVLTKAFEGGGDLQTWELVDISMSISQLHEAPDASVSGELLKDTGVLGILDKMVVSRANLFVSGSRRCSRYSSFTRQVIEHRQANWKDLRNVVSEF